MLTPFPAFLLLPRAAPNRLVPMATPLLPLPIVIALLRPEPVGPSRAKARLPRPNTKALLRVPSTLSLETLQESLETLADDLMVELRSEE